MSTANFYEILQCSENASYEQLKCKYKQLILQYHPDKLNEDTDIALSMPPSTSSSSSSNNDERFHLINTAWNTLKDPIKRKLYDAELCQNRFQLHNNVFDRLRVADLEIEICNVHNDDGNDDDDDGDGVGGSGEVTERTIRTYRCRCGGQYIVDDEAEIPTTDEDELLIECTECSLVIVLRR